MQYQELGLSLYRLKGMKKLPASFLALPLMLVPLMFFSACTSESISIDAVEPTAVDEPKEPSDKAQQANYKPEDVILVWSDTGGCAMAGPNCARYEITANGEVQTFRGTDQEVANTGAVEVLEVQGWLEVVDGTDFAELQKRLGPGEMTAAFDGVDSMLKLPAVGPRASAEPVELSSVEVEFDRNEPFFAETSNLISSAVKAAPLEPTYRQ